MINKKKILLEARRYLSNIISSIKNEIIRTEKVLKISKEKFAALSYSEKIIEGKIISNSEKRVDELMFLSDSPYFIKCNVKFEGENREEDIYFGKFNFSENDIYSWVTPASTMRFEKPGDISYKCPDGRIQKLKLLQKDQYIIADGKIKLLSLETISNKKELVYGEHFSAKKSGFFLPEIVAQMEKAQDKIIRADHFGPFLISGPAGSGKTTLALHRVAYLAQSPDLSDFYISKSIIVFVQDDGTKEYFSHILPELGIEGVEITTFKKWAFEILGIDGEFIERYGDSEYEKDLYEFNKLKAIKLKFNEKFSKSQTFLLLEKAYDDHLDDFQKKIFSQQKKERIYDRIDLTILLKIFYADNGLSVIKDYYIEQDNGKARKKRGPVLLNYSLIVIDEFQNYLPDQLSLIKSCINEKFQSMLYVGDMAQRVKIGAIRSWYDIGENISEKRMVILEKVYRNTKNILQYAKKMGYDIEISDQLREGKPVEEYLLENDVEEINQIKKIISNNNLSTIGILAKESDRVASLKGIFKENSNVHVMTINEAQGLEFDVVILMDIGKNKSLNYGLINKKLAEEIKEIDRDIFYMAITRAMSELHIIKRK